MKKYNRKENLVKLLLDYKMLSLISTNNNKHLFEIMFICYIKKKITKKELETFLNSNHYNINYKTLKNFDIDKMYLFKKNNYKIDKDFLLYFNEKDEINEEYVKEIEDIFSTIIKETNVKNRFKYVVFGAILLILTTIIFFVLKRVQGINKYE